MEDLYIEDPTTNQTFHLRVDTASTKRALADPAFATEIVQRYVRAHKKKSIYNCETQGLGIDEIREQIVINENSAAEDMPLSSRNNQILEDFVFQDLPNQTTSFWTRNETLALISAYDHFKENLNHYKKKKFIWSSIGTYLSERGIMKTEKAIETKWKNLLRTYKNIKDNNNSSGRGAIRFQFMDEMEEVIGERPLIQNTHSVGVGITQYSSGSYTISPCSSQNGTQQSAMTSETSQDNSEDLGVNITSTPKKKEEASTISTLKRKYLREKMDAMNEKKNQLQEYLRIKKAREEREEKKLELKKRELDIEERKLQAMELFLQLQMQKK